MRGRLRHLVACAAALAQGTAGGAVVAEPSGPGSTRFYSPLAAINSDNVAGLGFAWEFKTGTYRGMEATPLLVDGLLYSSGPWGVVYALDAVTGRLVWQFDPHGESQVARYASVDIA